jgi:DNA ligase-4
MVHSLFYLDFVNTPPSYNLDYFHKLVVENGGSFSMNLNDSVTHCIAAEKKGIPLFSCRTTFFFILSVECIQFRGSLLHSQVSNIRQPCATEGSSIIHGSWTVPSKNVFFVCNPSSSLGYIPYFSLLSIYRTYSKRNSLYRYILFLADFARHKFPEEIDSYADFYYWDIDVADLKQV